MEYQRKKTSPQVLENNELLTKAIDILQAKREKEFQQEMKNFEKKNVGQQ